MIKVQHSIVVNRPVSEVFAFVCDPSKRPEWQDGLVRAHISAGGALTVGAEIIGTRKFMGREINARLQITEFEQDKLLVTKSIDGPIALEIRQTFEAIEDGTKAAIEIQAEPGGFFKLAEGMVQNQMQSQLVADSDRLKKLMEN